MLRQSLWRATLAGTIAAVAACAGDGATGPDAYPVGRYELALVRGARIPTTIADRLGRLFVTYESGSLTMRPDSTFDLTIGVTARGTPDRAINGVHAGTFQWTATTEGLVLTSDQHFQFTGVATADTVNLYSVPSPSQQPPPGAPWDFTFVRVKR